MLTNLVKSDTFLSPCKFSPVCMRYFFKRAVISLQPESPFPFFSFLLAQKRGLAVNG